MTSANDSVNPSSLDVCLVATVPYSLAVFMTPHIKALSGLYRVTLVANGSAEAQALGLGTSVSFRELGSSVEFQHLAISRSVSGLSDLRALVDLWRLFRRRRYQVVQSITPKAGLLSMLAARLAGVPVRVHWFTGQVWATRTGVSRWLFKTMDRVLVASATHVLADSASQRKFLEHEGVARGGQIVVLGHGSVCGVDTHRFRPDAGARSRIREGLGIPREAVAALFLGRLTLDKGLPELAEAFTIAAAARPDLHLIVVGADEGLTRASMARTVASFADRLHFVDYTDEPEAFMAASDIFVLPSRREGFGSSIIEAAACEVPAIGSRIYGLTDAIADGETGILVAAGDVGALAAAMIRLAADPALRAGMGQAARRRVERQFKQEYLTSELLRFYQNLASSRSAHR